MTPSQELLKRNNPFCVATSVNANEIWTPPYPDVESIHKSEFTKLIELVELKQKYPAMAISALIIGESGTGKSQLLVRTAKYCSQRGDCVSLANIGPILEETEPIGHLMHHIIAGLHEEFISRSDSPLCKRLISEMISDYLHTKNTSQDVIDSQLNTFFSYHDIEYGEVDKLSDEIIKWLENKEINVRSDFVRVLFQWWNCSRRCAARKWMGGETLEEDEAKLLRIPVNAETGGSSPITEKIAMDHLLTLGILLKRYKQTLLVFFDQLETLRDNPAAQQSLGKMVQVILTQCQGIMPITLARTSLWNEEFQNNLDETLVKQISENKYYLRGCDEQQIEELIMVRIQHHFGEEWEVPHQWLIQQIRTDDTLAYHPIPREIFATANKIITDKVSLPEEILQREYAALLEKTFQKFDDSSVEFDLLLLAIETYLSGIGVSFERRRKEKGTNTAFLESNSGWAILLNTESPQQVIDNCFEDGFDYLRENPKNICVYLTDPRCIFTKEKWDKTNLTRKAFAGQGGIIYQPDEEEISRYYALSHLKIKVIEGNIRNENNKECTLEDLHSFIKNTSYLKPLIDVEKMHKDRVIRDTLSQAPHATLLIDEVIEKCKERGVSTTYKYIKDFCDSNRDLYFCDETKIHVKEYWIRVCYQICEVMDRSGLNMYTIDKILAELGLSYSIYSLPSEVQLLDEAERGTFHDSFKVRKNKDGYIIIRI